MKNTQQSQQAFVHWFRNSLPYIRAFRGKTFVIVFGGEMLADAQFPSLVHDIALLNNLGIRLVLVHGARPQIEKRLQEKGIEWQYSNGLRITDVVSLECVIEAAGSVRVEIEALLSMGLTNAPDGKADIRVVSGNFVTAQPLGVRGGVDYQHTGEVRRIDHLSIQRQLEDGHIVLLSPMGYSPTGEIFNLTAEDLATTTAIQLKAAKLIVFTDEDGIADTKGKSIRELTFTQAQTLLQQQQISVSLQHSVAHAIKACSSGVPRVHLINRAIDGGLLLELFTRDGIGTLISAQTFEDTRQATIEDIGGILELLEPLEQEGILIHRSRELLEMEIQHFTVVTRDGLIVAVAALYPYPEEKAAELACLAVHRDYRDEGRGHELFDYITKQAKHQKLKKLFVLTTRTADWFRERGFQAADVSFLPAKKQGLYNYSRQSKVFIKDL
jgi:amino-acid N-acetyltransferase